MQSEYNRERIQPCEGTHAEVQWLWDVGTDFDKQFPVGKEVVNPLADRSGDIVVHEFFFQQ